MLRCTSPAADVRPTMLDKFATTLGCVRCQLTAADNNLNCHDVDLGVFEMPFYSCSRTDRYHAMRGEQQGSGLHVPPACGQDLIHARAFIGVQMRAAALPVPWPMPPRPPEQGDWLSVVASPFGVLSPDHFANCATAGLLSNVWRRDGHEASTDMIVIHLSYVFPPPQPQPLSSAAGSEVS